MLTEETKNYIDQEVAKSVRNLILKGHEIPFAKIDDDEITPGLVLEVVSSTLEIPIFTLKSMSRDNKQKQVDKRHIYFLLCKRYAKKLSMSKSAALLNRDHATGLSAAKRAEDLLTVDKEFVVMYEKAETVLKSIKTSASVAFLINCPQL